LKKKEETQRVIATINSGRVHFGKFDVRDSISFLGARDGKEAWRIIKFLCCPFEIRRDFKIPSNT
jgi:hypothetical protein